MTKQEFRELAQNIVLLDGATGSNLMAAGMPKGGMHRGMGAGA